MNIDKDQTIVQCNSQMLKGKTMYRKRGGFRVRVSFEVFFAI